MLAYLLVVFALVVGFTPLEVLCVLGPELFVEGAGDEAPLEQNLHRPGIATLLRRALDLKVQVVAPVLQLKGIPGRILSSWMKKISYHANPSDQIVFLTVGWSDKQMQFAIYNL